MADEPRLKVVSINSQLERESEQFDAELRGMAVEMLNAAIAYVGESSDVPAGIAIVLVPEDGSQPALLAQGNSIGLIGAMHIAASMLAMRAAADPDGDEDT